MRFLLAGGAGEVGRHLSGFLLDRGHEVIVLDKAASPAMGKGVRALTVIRGDLADKSSVVAAAHGADVIVNLAWSFSEDAATVFREDVGGHANLLAAAVSCQVKRFIYASTAAVYGAPQGEPVTEEHPCLPARARKPLYALGKLAAEELCGIFHREKGLATTVIRFWWAFGDTIGGRHLRDMIRAALNGEPLEIAAGAGGTFVTMNDLAAFCEASCGQPATAGGVYNIGSLFLTWTEIAAMIIETVDSRSCLVEWAGNHWTGPAFLNERWRLSCDKAARETGFRPASDSDRIRQVLRQALGRCADKVALEAVHV